MSFELMNAHKFSINTTPGATPGTLAPIAKGITDVQPNNNEQLSQDNYMDGDGFGETDVIGAQPILTFTGHRFFGDPAQDYIFSKTLDITSRRTNFEWTEPDGGKISGDCTIANISGPSGAAGAKGEISFEIHFNKKPTYTPPAGA